MTSNAVQRPQPEGRDFHHGLIGAVSVIAMRKKKKLTG